MELNIILVKIFFDGASRNNPGESGAGWVIDSEDFKQKGYEYLGIKTNNQAEYSAIVRALQTLKKISNSNKVTN